ncbi:bifunctional DNA primase/polymerase [Kribbella sp. NPDC023972]|uniref:bifunctional DNA primase/polymerase n=1 Tax=Kribbella sp. NPDC023972 TaxID=3154795 RepID=UPI0033F44B24
MNTTTNPRARTKRSGARGTGPDRLARAAHWHAARGLAVFPLRPCSKTPAIEDWPHNATTDAEQITRWWREAPYNIGVATGASGLLVIDLDQPKDGEAVPEPWDSRGATCGRDVLDQLADDAGQAMPRTWTVSTPSGGQHLYYRQPDGTELGNTAGRLGWKIDTRGNGGYVVGAGSVIRGQRYRADVIRRPASLPRWVAAALTPQPDPTPRSATDRRNASAYTLAALTGELDKVLAAVPGQRNDSLNRAAFALGQLVGAHLLDEGAIRDELVSAADRIGLPRNEADRTITSGLTAGERHPRQRNA